MIVIMMTTMTTMTVTGLSGLSLETFSKLDCKNFNLRYSYTDGKWYVRDNTGPSGIKRNPARNQAKLDLLPTRIPSFFARP